MNKIFYIILSLILAALGYQLSSIISFVIFIVTILLLIFWKNAGANTKMLLKTLLAAGLVGATAVLGFIMLILAAYSGTDAIAVIIFIATLIAIALIELTVFKILKPKVLLISWGALVALIIVSASPVIAYRVYHNSIPVVSTYLSPADFRPYNIQDESDRLAMLEETPALLITENLPRLDGATAFYPVYAAFAKAVYPRETLINDLDARLEGEEITVACSTTRSAYRNLIEGDRDIIFVLAPSKGQMEAAAEAGKELIFTPIGREGFVFFVNSANPVNNLTEEQIRAVYSGKIANWKELGGENRLIKAFQRNEGSGSQSAFLRFMGDETAMAPIMAERVGSMGGIIHTTADYKNYKNAIGFSFRYYTQQMAHDAGIKLLSINGVAPDRENISSGLYPLNNNFYAVTVAGDESAEVKTFIEWILSPQGQEIIEKTGYSPLK